MKATDVTNWICLGDMADAAEFPLSRLCVLEQPQYVMSEAQWGDYWVPILSFPNNIPRASRENLDKAKEVISLHEEKRRPLLVHCGAGIERSPLTVAWWLWKTRRVPSLAEAYNVLMRIRPIVQDRIHWLAPEDRV